MCWITMLLCNAIHILLWTMLFYYHILEKATIKTKSSGKIHMIKTNQKKIFSKFPGHFFKWSIKFAFYFWCRYCWSNRNETFTRNPNIDGVTGKNIFKIIGAVFQWFDAEKHIFTEKSRNIGVFCILRQCDTRSTPRNVGNKQYVGKTTGQKYFQNC